MNPCHCIVIILKLKTAISVNIKVDNGHQRGGKYKKGFASLIYTI